MINLIMCRNFNCRIREKCFRYRKKPQKYRQAYYPDNPGDEDTCSQFFPRDGEDNILSLDECDKAAQVGNLTDAEID